MFLYYITVEAIDAVATIRTATTPSICCATGDFCFEIHFFLRAYTLLYTAGTTYPYTHIYICIFMYIMCRENVSSTSTETCGDVAAMKREIFSLLDIPVVVCLSNTCKGKLYCIWNSPLGYSDFWFSALLNRTVSSVNSIFKKLHRQQHRNSASGRPRESCSSGEKCSCAVVEILFSMTQVRLFFVSCEMWWCVRMEKKLCF